MLDDTLKKSMPFSLQKHHVAWIVLSLVPAFFLLLIASKGSASIPLIEERAVVSKELDRVDMRAIPSCEQVKGLCDAGRRLLMPRAEASTLKRLRDRGCKVRHELKDLTSLSCPDSVDLGTARSERAFRITDLFSATHIGANAVWAEGVEGEGVRVAVLDTGIETNHPELEGKVVAQADFTGTGLQDAFGHGTHVSAIISGAGIKDLDTNRVIGTSPKVSLLVGKVCRDDGWCLEGDILAGIEWAVQQKARVLNLSLGGGSFDTHCDGDALANEVNRAVDQGVVVVAAAGNSGGGIASPACASRAIAVGAVDSLNNVPAWSSRGEALDVVAPGVSILSAYSCEAGGSCPGPWYAKLSGTSMAAPHVAATVALLLQERADLQPQAIYDLLTKTSADFGSFGFDTVYGHGRIDALAAYTRLSSMDPIESEEDAAKECLDIDGDGVDSCRDCDDFDKNRSVIIPEICENNDEGCRERVARFCQINLPKEEQSMCGNGICEGTENTRSCAVDCATIIPPRATEQSNGRAGGASRAPDAATGGAPNAAGNSTSSGGGAPSSGSAPAAAAGGGNAGGAASAGRSGGARGGR